MRRRDFIVAAGAAIASPLSLSARQSVWRLGFLGSGATTSGAVLVLSLKDGLRENGLIEDKDYALDTHWAEGDYSRFSKFAEDLIARHADVILVTTIAAARAVQRATSSIPIVMMSLNDPVGNGLVASLARPGGNTTGLATLNEDTNAKVLDILRELLPKATRVALLFNPSNPSHQLLLDTSRKTCQRRGIAIEQISLGDANGLDEAFQRLTATPPDAAVILPDAALHDFSDRVAAFGLSTKMPLLSSNPETTEFGGLPSYGVSRRDNYRRAGYFVRKLLDGAKATDLPVEQPTRMLLSVNSKTAKAIGVDISPMLLARADEVIE